MGATLPSVGIRFSGHETFACRYAWLPKAFRALTRDIGAFADEEAAMAELGLGKNMVRSLRFWVEAMGLAVPSQSRCLVLTDFSRAVFSEDGFDPYLEDILSLWLLHWNLSSRSEGALFAWRFLLNQWPYPELTRTEVIAAFVRESAQLGFSHSAVTLAQHLDVFLHTYYSARSGEVGVEDSLEGPLVELAFLQKIGERKVEGGHWETVYAFRREPKPEINAAMFDYCLEDFWNRFRPGEETLTLREVALAPCSPGQVLRFSEDDVRARLETYATANSKGPFSYQPSAVQGLLSRRKSASRPTLAAVYEWES
jgi:hypothetical protein